MNPQRDLHGERIHLTFNIGNNIVGGYLQEYDTVDAYKVGSIVLADLGEEGKLYGYEELPKPFATVAVTQKSPIPNEEVKIYTCLS